MSRRAAARAPLTIRAPSRPGSSKTSGGGPTGARGAVGPRGPKGEMNPGEYHVDDFGAQKISIGEDRDQAAVAMRNANVLAFNNAIAAARANPNGGIVTFGPGVYLTNNPVGLNVHTDTNCNLIFKGTSQYDLIQSNNLTLPTIWFHTDSGNIRNLTMRDFTIRGGREGLSLTWAAYSTFERVWFWGSANVGLQNHAGNGNAFIKCRFDESAQGTSNGTEAEACHFISCEDTLIGCNFGEYCGGLILNGGDNTVIDCLYHDCKYRGRDFFDYLANVNVVISGPFMNAIAASIILWQGSAVISACRGNCIGRYISTFRAYELIVTGCRFQTDQGSNSFIGFINMVKSGGTECALNIGSSTFVWTANQTAGGYFIADPDNYLHDSQIEAQLVVYSGSQITDLGIRGGANNYANLQFTNH